MQLDGIIFFDFVVLLVIELGTPFTVRATPYYLTKRNDSNCHFDRQEGIQRVYVYATIVRLRGSTSALQLAQVLHC